MEIILQNQFLILAGLFILGFGITGWFLLDLTRKTKILFGGTASKDEAGLQKDLVRRLAKTEAKLEEFEPRVKLLEEISQISVQKVGFVRFNPFQDTGGDNSFVLALLDRKQNGVLISSLYMREGIRLYAKRVEGGRTKQQLSEEEARVLQEVLEK